MYMDAEYPCWVCGKKIRGIKETRYSPYLMYELDSRNPHTHTTISVTNILTSIHHSRMENKSQKIGDMTLAELEHKIHNIASGEAAKLLGSYLHAQHGFSSHDSKKELVTKIINVDGREFFILGKPDDVVNDVIIEAKYVRTRKGLNENLKYPRDQCDIYGWITGIKGSKILVHIMDENKQEDEYHQNDPIHAEKMITDYIRDNFSTSKKFAVFCDLDHATEIKIHKLTCSAYTSRDPAATTTEWHIEPTLWEAINKARQLSKEHGMTYRYCKWCKMEQFAVFHDFWKTTDIKIHRIDCTAYVNRKLDATTVEWYAVPSYQDATNVAQNLSNEDGIRYSDCMLCSPKG
ncbi:MAG: hypothetical protein EB830_05705 [Nitrosopumilus sp. H13]|nr:MAG: hypothetical protein EB830_05705 [Nitrosopumilus sp. H13]